MSANGPILILEDDKDDQDILESAFIKLGISNNRLYFDLPSSFIDYLAAINEQPFIIFSDVNLPMVNGIQLKKSIEANERLRSKTIPYIFLSTYASKSDIATAYNLSAQGFFVKGKSFEIICRTLEYIVQYWRLSLHPNSAKLD